MHRARLAIARHRLDPVWFYKIVGGTPGETAPLVRRPPPSQIL